MDVVINWENQYLEPRDYRLKMIANDADNEWSWEESFTITEEDAKNSDEAVELEKHTWLKSQLLISIFAVLINIIIVLLVKNKIYCSKRLSLVSAFLLTL